MGLDAFSQFIGVFSCQFIGVFPWATSKPPARNPQNQRVFADFLEASRRGNAPRAVHRKKFSTGVFHHNFWGSCPSMGTICGARALPAHGLQALRKAIRNLGEIRTRRKKPRGERAAGSPAFLRVARFPSLTGYGWPGGTSADMSFFSPRRPAPPEWERRATWPFAPSSPRRAGAPLAHRWHTPRAPNARCPWEERRPR